MFYSTSKKTVYNTFSVDSHGSKQCASLDWYFAWWYFGRLRLIDVIFTSKIAIQFEWALIAFMPFLLHLIHN